MIALELLHLNNICEGWEKAKKMSFSERHISSILSLAMTSFLPAYLIRTKINNTVLNIGINLSFGYSL